ncbi:hypothetical protein ABIB00_007357 [Bradyrhizobium sp. LB14.3]|uniref:hypothetical protein n=1 Tax=Bradyrhizobium sp. LB14.3 TaxID=3156328 RepID=UPI003396B596
MDNEALAGELNALAHLINQASEKLDAISRIPGIADTLRHAVPQVVPGSPFAILIEQAERWREIMPEPSEPTKWSPPN